jgi:hypothetical protein
VGVGVEVGVRVGVGVSVAKSGGGVRSKGTLQASVATMNMERVQSAGFSGLRFEALGGRGASASSVEQSAPELLDGSAAGTFRDLLGFGRRITLLSPEEGCLSTHAEDDEKTSIHRIFTRLSPMTYRCALVLCYNIPSNLERLAFQ